MPVASGLQWNKCRYNTGSAATPEQCEHGPHMHVLVWNEPFDTHQRGIEPGTLSPLFLCGEHYDWFRQHMDTKRSVVIAQHRVQIGWCDNPRGDMNFNVGLITDDPNVAQNYCTQTTKGLNKMLVYKGWLVRKDESGAEVRYEG